jgi:hypothetical protein
MAEWSASLDALKDSFGASEPEPGQARVGRNQNGQCAARTP